MYSVWGYIVQGEDRQGQFAPILRAEYKSNRAFVLRCSVTCFRERIMSRKKTGIMLAGILLLLTACGQDDSGREAEVLEEISPGEISSAVTEAENSPEPEIDRSACDWRDGGWLMDARNGMGGQLYVANYIDNLPYEPEYGYLERDVEARGVWGDIFYIVECFTDLEGADHYYMDLYHGDTGEIAYVPLDIASYVERTDKSILNVDIMSDEEYVCFVQGGMEGQSTELTAVHLGRDGNVLREAALYPGPLEEAMGQAGEQGWWGRPQVDREGNYYVGSAAAGKVLVQDNVNGKSHVLTPFPENRDNPAVFCMKTFDGQPVYEVNYYDGKASMLFTYDGQEQELKQLSLQDYRSFGCGMMTDEGMCYFYNHQKLYSWDLYTGKWNLLLDGSKEDLAKNEGYCYLAIDGAENLMLFDCEEEPGIYILSEQEPSTENYARIVSLTTSCSDLSSAAADFTRKNPAQGLLVEPPERDQQAYRARVMADMTAGKVPDALYVSGEDMEILYEKGLLMDMTGLLPEQVTEQLFPGILECGRIDGKQTGFPLKATIDTMFVNRKVWQEDGWSLADVMELAYCSGELEAVIATAKPPYAARGALENLALQDLGHSPFVDLEAGTCSFDSEQFIELLELCSGCGKIVTQPEDAAAMVEEGRAIAYTGNTDGIIDFGATMRNVGVDYYAVGFPTEEGSGCYWDCDYYLVVSRDTDKWEVINRFLEHIYSLERQRKLELAIRRDVYTKYVETWPETGEVMINQGGGYYIPVATKPDGTDWLEDYLELAERCEPRSRGMEAIVEIVLEEADSFFAGDKDAAAVAGIIQSRVQMYLAERG